MTLTERIKMLANSITSENKKEIAQTVWNQLLPVERGILINDIKKSSNKEIKNYKTIENKCIKYIEKNIE